MSPRGLARVPRSPSAAWAATMAFMVANAVGCASGPAPSLPPPKDVTTQNQILGKRVEGTPAELREKGERAVLAQRWQEAVDAFETLLAGDPASNDDPQVLFDLGVAYEGLGQREKARERYREVTRRFEGHGLAAGALAREVSLDAYLEDWPALGDVGQRILARKDLDPATRMLGLGSRGLARIQAGEENAASHDIQEGLDLVDEHRYGATGQLPVAAAMLKFAHGELREFRSEKIVLDPPGPDFVLKLEMRCQGLLDAQSAYADAIRSIDPLWAAMSGFRVGEMYRKLHGELMRIPPTDKAKTESDKQLFYGIMHVRYRALLEKGIEMMKRTLGLGERTGAASPWMVRAQDAKDVMEKALEEEKQTIAGFPFTEAEIEKALQVMKKNAEAAAAKSAKK